MNSEGSRYIKDFDGWNTVKKLVHERVHDTDFYYYAREVWWCSVGVNVDVESVHAARNIWSRISRLK